jgi:molecular chaperone GrpE
MYATFWGKFMSEKENVSENAEQQEPESPQAQEDLQLLLEDARAKADDHYNQLLRTQAEMENLRKRSSRELENAHKFALEKFVNELLPVRDSMEMGIGAASEEGVDPVKLKEGMDLTLKMFGDVMAKFGVAEVNPQGQKFNPELHQAMSMQEAPDVEPTTVLIVVQKGYQLNERLVRPALVIVSSGGSKSSEAGEYRNDEGRSGGQVDEQA